MMKNYAEYEWTLFMTMDKNRITVEEISTQNLHCYCDDLWGKEGYFKASHVEITKETIVKDRTEYVTGYLC